MRTKECELGASALADLNIHEGFSRRRSLYSNSKFRQCVVAGKRIFSAAAG